jgi:hypothetical protein
VACRRGLCIAEERLGAACEGRLIAEEEQAGGLADIMASRDALKGESHRMGRTRREQCMEQIGVAGGPTVIAGEAESLSQRIRQKGMAHNSVRDASLIEASDDQLLRRTPREFEPALGQEHLRIIRFQLISGLRE